MSITHFHSESAYEGIELNISGWHNSVRIHAGFESGWGVIGWTAGPTWVNREGKTSWGCSFTEYVIAVAIPYFSQHFYLDESSDLELGGYLKFPVQIGGRGIFD